MQPGHQHISSALTAKHKLCTAAESRETARGWQLCQPTLRAWSIRVLSVRCTQALLPPIIVRSHNHCCSLSGAGSSAGARLAGALSGHCDSQRQTLSKPPLPLPCRNRDRDNLGYSQGVLLTLAFLSSRLPLPCLDAVELHIHLTQQGTVQGHCHTGSDKQQCSQ